MGSNFGKVRNQNTCSSQLQTGGDFISQTKQQIQHHRKNILPNVRIAVLLCMPKIVHIFGMVIAKLIIKMIGTVK